MGRRGKGKIVDILRKDLTVWRDTRAATTPDIRQHREIAATSCISFRQNFSASSHCVIGSGVV